jgi:hypothetical protein
MVFTASKILVLIACILAVVAFVVVMVDASNAKLWPETMALSLAFGWASFLVP